MIEDSLEENEKMQKATDNLIHGIRNSLTGVSEFLNSHKDLPKEDRQRLREIVERLAFVTNRFLSQQPVEYGNVFHAIQEDAEQIFVYDVISKLLKEKKSVCLGLPIEFELHVNDESASSHIYVEPLAFQEILMHLLQDAIDAYNEKKGLVTIHIGGGQDDVTIILKDNGKIKPRKNNEYVASDFESIQAILENNDAQLSIDAQSGLGTQRRLTFPKSPTPSWMATEVHLFSGDTVIVLDDDPGVFAAWEARLGTYVPEVTLKYSRNTEEIFKMLRSLRPEEREKIVLLTDYEISHQKINGAQLIKTLQQKRSIIVTNHYENTRVRTAAVAAQATLLPRALIAHIPIIFLTNASVF
jgi:hypothetical protein